MHYIHMSQYIAQLKNIKTSKHRLLKEEKINTAQNSTDYTQNHAVQCSAVSVSVCM